MVKLTCTSCRKPLSIDETKLPMKVVSFPCPACKTKLSIDRRTLPSEGAPLVAAPLDATVPPLDEDDEFGEKLMIVGADSPALRAAAKAIGYQPVHFPAAEAARDFFLREYPPVVVLAPAQITAPPLAEMAPITNLGPVDRRKGFFILVADGLRTLDGNAAFLYGVNLVVGAKDMGSMQTVFRDAMTFHKRLYQSLDALLPSH